MKLWSAFCIWAKWLDFTTLFDSVGIWDEVQRCGLWKVSSAVECRNHAGEIQVSVELIYCTTSSNSKLRLLRRNWVTFTRTDHMSIIQPMKQLIYFKLCLLWANWPIKSKLCKKGAKSWIKPSSKFLFNLTTFVLWSMMYTSKLWVAFLKVIASICASASHNFPPSHYLSPILNFSPLSLPPPPYLPFISPLSPLSLLSLPISPFSPLSPYLPFISSLYCNCVLEFLIQGRGNILTIHDS